MKSSRGDEGHPEYRGEVSSGEADASRRDMLAKIGRFAYAAPALAILAEPKLADAYGRKPGYGYGDPNHEHSGPPGLNK
jgi:hypothetical protein